jgi:RNA polymerase primary sigma factor
VLAGQPKRPSAREKGLENEGEASDEVELDLTPGVLETTNDAVRTYLCEMGAVPLLTRDAEVDIAKRIERGQLRVLKALSRTPVVIRQVLTIGEDLRRGVRSIRDIVVFDEEEVTEHILQNRVKDLIQCLPFSKSKRKFRINRNKWNSEWMLWMLKIRSER